MPIITENQKVKAGIAMDSAGLHIEFQDDPSYIRSETVLVDLMQRSIGLIFESGYHHIGDLPKKCDQPGCRTPDTGSPARSGAWRARNRPSRARKNSQQDLKLKERHAMTRCFDTYVDSNGNKIVEPVFHGNGCVGGMVGIKK